ncbi:hypothetical protein ACFV3R_02675 [Streptomyces sp. NPDC059740]|uniref:hypothetical protein n=1 Tax=Streptomyces sp. NPDC059740 TaxID=3346926 RepID=UPI0036661E78
MPESQDPLRSLFRQAAETGRARAVPAPASYITERGRRARRHRLALTGAAACLVAGCGLATAVHLLPPAPATSTVPATSPAPSGPAPTSPPPTSPPSGTPSSGTPSHGAPSGGPGTATTSLPPSATTSATSSATSTQLPGAGATRDPSGTATTHGGPTTSAP